MNIETLLPWGQPSMLQTKAGERILRKASPTQDFWAEWKANKEKLKSAGIIISKYNGDWEVCWWQSTNPAADAARREKERQQKLAEQAALESDCQQLPPELETRFNQVANKLLPYQRPSVRRLVRALQAHNGALDASDTGTGKTFCALAAAAVLGYPVYVVCPKAVIPSWKRAGVHFGINVECCNYELLRRGEQPALCLTNPGTKDEDVKWLLPAGTLIVFDEVHRCKDSKTWNCAMALAAVRQRYPVLALSATAADNPLQMKFVALLCRLYAPERAFWGWATANGCNKGRWGMEFIGGKKILQEIHKKIFPLHGSRIRIADLGDQFPETQITAECYDLNGASNDINRIYDEMADAIARLEAKEDMDARSRNACILVEMLRARQRAELMKVPAVVAMAEDAIEEGQSVAIFVNFNETVDALRLKLKTDCVVRGEQKADEREKCIQDFQFDKSHVIICNIRAGGVGISLHGSTESRQRMSIIFPTWSGQDLKQALGRVHRAGGAKSLQRIFFAAGTIEEQVCQQVRDKIEHIDLINDGDLALRGESLINFDALPNK